MARKLIVVAALAASVASAMAPATAIAQDHYDGGWSQGPRHDDGRGWNDRHYDRRYDDRGGYYARTGYAGDGYYGRPDYRYRCRGDGTTGAIIGAVAGGLLGNGLAGYGNRTLGTVLGGGAGALAGRAIDRSDNRC